MVLNLNKIGLTILIFLCFWLGVKSTVENEMDYAKHEAQFAVAELRKLSDSGVYESLSLDNILSYSFEDVSYHRSTSLKLSLASPHFQSGEKRETFEVVVLTHKEDGVKSLAIDNFPVMTDSSMEQYLVGKAKRKKLEREESFRYLEIGRVLGGDDLRSKSVKAHLEELDSPEALKEREKTSLDVQRRLLQPYLSEEKALSRLSLAALYDVSLGSHSDFQVERARAVLDNALLVKQV
jgi:hypothetical protein